MRVSVGRSVDYSMIRQLTPNDTELLREAFSWREQMPRWYREMDSVNGRELTLDEFLADSTQTLEFAVFDDEMIGLISLAPLGNDRYEAHLKAKRGADPEKLALAAFSIRAWAFKNGAKEIVAWVCRQHVSVKHLLGLGGLLPDTVTRIKGFMHGKLIYWERWSARA